MKPTSSSIYIYIYYVDAFVGFQDMWCLVLFLWCLRWALTVPGQGNGNLNEPYPENDVTQGMLLTSSNSVSGSGCWNL